MKKLTEKKGFSLTEMLMTVLLLSIVLTGVTTGASVILNSYRKVTNKANAVTLLSTLIVAVNADLKMASEIKYDTGTPSGGKVSSFYSGMAGRSVVMKFVNISAEDGSPAMVGFQYLKSSNVDGTMPVYSEVIPLVSKETYPDKLNAKISDVVFHPDTGNPKKGYFDYTVTVYIDESNPLAEQRVCIRPVS